MRFLYQEIGAEELGVSPKSGANSPEPPTANIIVADSKQHTEQASTFIVLEWWGVQ